MLLNFEKSYFEYKFRRKAKVWTIEMVHDLWLRAKDRGEYRRKDLTDCIDEIVNTIEPTNKNHRQDPEYRVYYNSGKNICYYNISKSSLGFGYGYSRDMVKFGTRDEKLTFLLANQTAFDLGEKMRRLEKLCSNQHYRVKDILNKMIEENLRKKLTDYDRNDVIIVQISDKSYFVKIDSSHFPYKSFELLNEVTPETTIKL
jgi:hypothetical protein